MDKYCLASALVPDSNHLPGHGLCNGYLETLLYPLGYYWMAHTGNDLKKYIQEHLDEPGTYLIVGIGVHDSYDANKVIKQYLKPAFDTLKGHKWPKVCT